MVKSNWHTFSEASRLLGKNRNYFSNRYKLTPKAFKAPNFKIIGGVKFINDEGIQEVINSIKKVVDHLRNRASQMVRQIFLAHILSLQPPLYYKEKGDIDANSLHY